MLLAFHVCLHARPPQARGATIQQLAGGAVATLEIAPADLPPLSVSFEEAAAALSELPRMYCEPDGSFVWVSPAGEPPWQVDGVLYDRGGRLLFVDLKGNCPSTEFDRLLGACGWPAAPVLFQLVRQAVFVEETEFRRLAAQPVAS